MNRLLLSCPAATLALGIALTFSGCTSTHKNYHPELAAAEEHTPSAVWREKGSGKPYFGFVEFDDQGERWDSSIRAAKPGQPPTTQLQAVTRAIKQAGGGGSKPFYLVVFAHGWNNNAKHNNGNLKNFHDRIKALRVLHAKEGVQVFGVFMAWRGDTSLFPVNFFHRSEAGHRVGERATGVLYDLVAAGRQASSNSKVALIGHSFGAHLIESGVLPVLAADVARASVDKDSRPVRPDLVLLVNPARSSLYSKPLVDQLRDARVSVEGETRTGSSSRELPLIVSVTSKGDSATGKHFPMGYLLGRRISLFNTSVAGDYRQSKDDPAPQSYSHQRTAGWNQKLHSHQVAAEPYGPQGSDPKLDPEPLSKAENNMKTEERILNRMIRANYEPWQKDGSILVHGLKQNYRITPVSTDPNGEAPYNDTPYWIMQVPEDLVKDHNDVWNSEYIGLVTALTYLPVVHKAREGKDPVKTPPAASTSSELTEQQLLLKLGD